MRLWPLLPIALLVGCSDFLSPVESTPEPTEYEFNYWLLQRTYLYEDELAGLPEKGDSVQALYGALSDRYTRYVEPSRSEAVTESRNTSIITGDIGLEYMEDFRFEHPLFVYRVYPESPAAKAGVPRYGNIISINGTELKGEDAYSTFRAVFSQSADIVLEIAFDDSVTVYSMHRESIYAPTIFVDTIQGTEVISIREFKPNTIDREKGTYGELRNHLDSTKGDTSVRIIDLRGNPGGHVDQCIPMADLFVRAGTLSTRSWSTFDASGSRIHMQRSIHAKGGDPGESGKFIILANNGSASCAEIFIAAVRELTDIPVAGTTTYGKGIGQSAWTTVAGGLATITTLEFKTPNGNSYHKKGIVPDYPCKEGATISCAVDAIGTHFQKSLKKGYHGLHAQEPTILRLNSPDTAYSGGAWTENLLF
ncbi:MULTISPECIES: S41 family peptidase [unclassified Fibrobacter]|uniref:S41 family peptidase n=1 Tax=unclassified Fibrobacter TaxID=2634177 RepID=UPI0025B81872|nr:MULTISPECIES: S41 family peptidase [unclassified Fibrobacter]